MRLTLVQTITRFAQMLQTELFPRLEVCGAKLTPEHKRVAAAIAMLPLDRFVPVSRGWIGRPAKDRLCIARAYVAKSVMNLGTTRQLLERLTVDSSLRGLCGWAELEHLPHESTFSRAFAEFAESELGQFTHEALIRETQQGRLIGHIARDSTAIQAREKFRQTPKQKQQREGRCQKRKSRTSHKGQKNRKLSKKAKRKEQTAKTVTGQQLGNSAEQILQTIPRECSIGAKSNEHGTKYWRGYKLHLDVADGQIPITALLSSANVHDSKLAIAMTQISTGRVTYLYELMDSAYDSMAIREQSEKSGHVAIIAEKTRTSGKTQLPLYRKRKPGMEPAKADRFRIRTMVERVNARLKDEFGAGNIRVRGAKKVMAHLMFGVLALTADQLLKFAENG